MLEERGFIMKSGPERTGWQSSTVRLLTTLLTLAMMFLIFWFSTQDAETSNETSGTFAQFILSVVSPEYRSFSPERQAEIIADVQNVIRKCAHFTEYAVLGMLLRFCLESWFGPETGIKYNIAGWLGGTLYACTDELHQMLVDGRSGQITDVLIDSSGVLLGTLAAFFIYGKFRKRRRKESEET